MMSRVTRICGAALGAVFLLAVAATPATASDITDAQAFIRTLADKAISQLTNPTMSAGEREEKFRDLLARHFDVPALGRSALGRYWRVATPDEQAEYMGLFEDLIVATYAQRFRDYGGENLDITNVLQPSGGDDASVVVQSQIVRNVAKPIRVDWRVAQPASDPKVVDVVIEGVSMMQTQRSEFSSVIVRNGNKVAGLIGELRAKNKSLRAQGN